MIHFTHFTSLYDPIGRRYRATWEELLTRLAKLRVMPKKGGAGISLGTYRGNHRHLDNVEAVYAVGLDLDHLDAISAFVDRPAKGEVIEAPDWDQLRKRFAATSAFVHTTWSSTLSCPRLRVFLRLSRPVTGDEYRRVYKAIATTCERGGLVVDRQASDPSRFWYLPSTSAAASFVFWTCDGPPIDVEAALRSVPAPAPPSPPKPRPPTPDGAPSPLERASKYLAKCAPAIQGSDGSTTTLLAAMRLVKGFCLTEEEAYSLLATEYNPRCKPPWSERDLRRKVRQAIERGQMREGALLDAGRRR